jgi:hypothetical protein
MTTLPIKARVLIGMVVVSGLAILGKSFSNGDLVHEYTRFASYFIVAVVAARFKITLPRMTSSMSVNLPFILAALLELSLGQALIVTAASAFAQSFWPESKKRNMIQVAFNVSVLVIAAQLTWMMLQLDLHNTTLAIALGACTVFLANTMPVAAIISFTEEVKISRTWTQILRLTFPYYLLAAGIAGLVKLANPIVGWQAPLFILPAMLLVYQSYAFCFRQMNESTLPRPAVMTAKAGSY